MFSTFWHCNVNYEAGLFLVVDQHDVRPKVKRNACRSAWGSPRRSWSDRSWLFFLVLPTSLCCSQCCTCTYSPVYYWGHIVVSFFAHSPCKLAAATDDMCHSLCMLLTLPASGILHSVVDLVCHCPGVEGLLLSCHDKILDVCSDVAFIEQLICAGYVCNFWHTFVPGTMQRIFIPGCSFIWLFLGGYEALAFSHQRVTFCFPADIGLQALFFLCTTFSMFCHIIPSLDEAIAHR